MPQEQQCGECHVLCTSSEVTDSIPELCEWTVPRAAWNVWGTWSWWTIAPSCSHIYIYIRLYIYIYTYPIQQICFNCEFDHFFVMFINFPIFSPYFVQGNCEFGLLFCAIPWRSRLGNLFSHSSRGEAEARVAPNSKWRWVPEKRSTDRIQSII